MKRFISLLTTISDDENHIASRYTRLLCKLWFQRPDTLTVSSLPINTDVTPAPWDMFNEFGLEGFSSTNTMDGFFAMPPVFPYDDSMFFNPKSDEANYYI
ncbi:unnamed protein product [Penicillium nalgiovense]|nr:unnamed protein product [Penicillium nalgiovense]